MRKFLLTFCSLHNLFILSCFFLFFPTGSQQTSTDDTLKLVQIIFRHGDREPDTAFPGGLGALTNLGKKQMYDLGQEIRRLYDRTIVDTKFDPTAVLIMSSDKDRTINSAIQVALGLYKKFNSEASWSGRYDRVPFEPIPVRTILKEYDQMLQFTATCPVRDKLILSSLEKYGEEFLQSHQELVENYSLHTRGDLSMLEQARTKPFEWLVKLVHEQEAILFNHTYNLPLPNWTLPLLENDAYMGIKAQVNRYFSSGPQAKLGRRFISGSLIKTLITNAEKRISRKSQRKLILYSAHDRTIHSLLIALDADDPRVINMPQIGSALMIELHQNEEDENSEPFLKLWYKNETNSNQRYLIKIPDCEEPCTLGNFKLLTKDIVPDNIEQECKATGGSIATPRQGEVETISKNNSANISVGYLFTLFFSLFYIILTLCRP